MRARRALAMAWLLALAFTVAGCPPVMYSRLYKPTQAPDAAVFAEADRKVFPDDVRIQGASVRPVAWAGVVRRVDETEVNGTRVWDLYVEHHYWTFIEDFGMQPQRALLSPRGEGMFRCRGAKSDAAQTEMTADTSRLRFIPTVAAGDMAIVVGKPVRVRWLLDQDFSDLRIRRMR